MSSLSPEAEPSLLSTVDVRGFIETVRVRWWVIPTVLLATVAFLQAQDSDLRTSPETVFVSRGYEIGSPFNRLSAVGINLNILEVPAPDTQLLVLKSGEVREEINALLGMEVEVQLPANWESPATFTCSQPLKDDCVRAIDAYIAKATEIRKAAITKGIDGLRAVLTDLQSAKPDPVVESQIAALNALEQNLEVPIVLVDEVTQSLGNTMTEVRRPTLLIGLAAGLLISLLILLQLSYSDSRIRSTKQVIRIVGQTSFIGELAKLAHPIRDRRAALSLYRQVGDDSAKLIRFIPLRDSFTDTERLKRLSDMVGASFEITRPFSDLTIPELVGTTNNAVDILLVQRNRDSRGEVTESFVGLQRSSRRVAGVLLTD